MSHQKLRQHFSCAKSFAALPLWLLFSILGLVAGGHVIVSGASLSVFPAAGTYAVGRIFSVDVGLSAKDPANVAGVTIAYPSDMLEVLDVSKQDSLFTLWIEDPEYKTSPGIIHFSGGVARRDGFTGEGKLATILFRAREIGEARVHIVDAEVLASDGAGTDMLLQKNGGVYTFTEDGGVEFDLDGNGVVNMKDLSEFVRFWGNAYDMRYDFNRNKKNDLNDLTLLVLVIVRGGGF